MAVVASFDLSAEGQADGDQVLYPDSLLFKAGDYPDRDFSMTPEEIRRYAEEGFAGPVPNELEHLGSHGQRTILDGRLGEVRDVWASEDGTELRGTVAIPRWLDAIWSGPTKKVSAAWDRATKTMKALGLVLDGRVPEAALMSAYAAFAATQAGSWKVGAARDLPLLNDIHAEWDGQAAQDSIFGDGDAIPADAKRGFLIYDASQPGLKGSYKLPFARREDGRLKASRAGLRAAAARLPRTDAPQAVLDRARAVVDGYQARFAKLDGSGSSKTASMSAGFAAPKRHEDVTAFMQGVHDGAAAMDPEVCMVGTKAARPGRTAGFADHPTQLKAVKQMHDLSVRHGANCSGGTVSMSRTPSRPVQGRSRMMGLKHALGRLLYGDQAPDVDPEVSDEQAAAIFAVATGEGVTIEPEGKVESTAGFADSPQYKEMKAELDRQKALVEEARRKEAQRSEAEIQARAATFAASLATGDPSRGEPPRITPVLAEAVAVVFAQAIRDDAAHEAVVTFSVGTHQIQGGRVAALEALFAALPGHHLLSQGLTPTGRLDPTKHQILFSDAATPDGITPERRKELLGMTPLGKAALNQPNGRHS